MVNAKLTFEFDDGLNNKVSKSTATDENGNYLTKLVYSTYSGSGFFVTHKCKFSPRELQLKIEVEGQNDFLETITISNESTTYNKAFNALDAANRSAH